ncbi:hypothetical protein ANO14919_072030 [Xylariales sp. No.14919]|nr:hypothetical protein ANO14919_072030 [Xylariales sp. No.14919]
MLRPCKARLSAISWNTATLNSVVIVASYWPLVKDPGVPTITTGQSCLYYITL